MKGANTRAAVARAELVACPKCDADPGAPCVTANPAMRTGRPHAIRARLAVEAAVFAGGRPRKRR